MPLANANANAIPFIPVSDSGGEVEENNAIYNSGNNIIFESGNQLVW